MTRKTIISIFNRYGYVIYRNMDSGRIMVFRSDISTMFYSSYAAAYRDFNSLGRFKFLSYEVSK